MKPLAIDLYCGLGGWTEGLLAEGYDVVGFDIERHVYGDHRYPAQLVLQDVRTLHGRQFKDVALIVGSSPCQEFSYRAMPWKRAKALGPPVLGMELFEAQFRIQREACEAAGRHVPMVVENVRGAIPWVGRSRWNFGSYHLWGDVPALMPLRLRLGVERPGHDWNRFKETGEVSPHWRLNGEDSVKGAWHSQAGGAPMRRDDSINNAGGSWFRVSHNNVPHSRGDDPRDDPRNHPAHSPHLTNPLEHDRGVKGFTPRGEPLGKNTLGRAYGSKSSKRKAASAMIAKIPLPLARHIAACWRPT